MKLTLLVLLIGTCIAVSKSNIAKSKDWNYLLFVQEWPPTRCEISVSEVTGKKEECEIPPYVSGWTIHGLWPQETCTTYPSFCNNSWPFDENKIKDLEPELKTEWPNMFPKEPDTSFWKHEWDKHGTCSANLPALDSEFKYFSTSLKMHKALNISKALDNAEVKPSSSKGYQMKDFEKAVQSTYGVVPQLDCVFKNGRQVLLQIFICVDKSLNIMDCTCSSHSCHDTKPLYFDPYP